jgi:Glucose / Sorbosone dehydrogenase
MRIAPFFIFLTVLTVAAPVAAQPPAAPAAPLPPGQTNDPFPTPIPERDSVVRINAREFATLPDIDGVAARMMNLEDVPGVKRILVNDMRGPLYGVSYDGATVRLYVDTNDPKWGHPVQSQGRERGFQSFTFHPQFAQAGTPGFGKFYTYTDTPNMTPAPDFTTAGEKPTHDTVLLEWTAKTPAADTYDGAAPRELMRWRQPFANHNGGHLTFNTVARPGSPEFGLLYIGAADGGSGGDPLNLSQNMASGFGKIFRIDPLGNNSRNKKYGIPANNPFVTMKDALPEIYAVGVRNPQRFAWDPRNGNMFVADIGQNIVEEVSPVTAGANLGWNAWEGSYRFISRQAVSSEKPRSDPAMTYPVAEWGQIDPLMQNQSAAAGLLIYRGKEIPQLSNRLLFSDNPSGEFFYVSADKLPSGGQEAIRRVVFGTEGDFKTFLQLIQAKNQVQGKKPATRADLRIIGGPANQIFLLNKGDGVIRVVAP